MSGCIECGNGDQGIDSNQILRQSDRILPDSGSFARICILVPSHVARSLIQHPDHRAALGVVFSEEILPAPPATVVVMFREGAFQVGSTESLRARLVGNSSRGAGEGFPAEGGTARLHDSGR